MALLQEVGFHNQFVYQPNVEIFIGYNKETEINYKFSNHFHPYVGELMSQLNRKSLPGLLDVNFHQALGTQPGANFFQSTYNPDPDNSARVIVDFEETRKKIDVTEHGAYSVYNWELLFHVPFTIAVHLSKNQRFAEAQRWFHYIFDPTSTDTSVPAPQRFWKFLAFREKTDVELIDDLMFILAKPAEECTADELEKKEDIIRAIEGWRAKPFQPHVVARTRFVAYQYSVVMKYIDNLVAWGDSLFRQDTIETINEATQLYVLAANILGPRPQAIPRRGTTRPQNFASLRNSLDAFGNALVEMEGQFPFNLHGTATEGAESEQTQSLFGIGRTLYFGIPKNDKLLSYWDTVADRLFKIRHCMNIEGVVRQLPLFEPPIDPGMLVKAAAAGIDISSLVSGMNQPPAPVRSPFMIQKAIEICSEVRSLGASLLTAIEKRDAEELARLRQTHEIAVQELVREVRFQQWKESEANTETLLQSRQSAFERFRHYQRLLGRTEDKIAPFRSLQLERRQLLEGSEPEEKVKNFDSIYQELIGQYAGEIGEELYPLLSLAGGSDPLAEGAGKLLMNLNEFADLNLHLPTGTGFQVAKGVLQNISSVSSLIPEFPINLHYWGIGATIEFGGREISRATALAADILGVLATIENAKSTATSKTAGLERRAEDWIMQSNQATKEMAHIGRQIVASLIREQIAKQEYESHLRQIEQAREIDTFLQSKFTNTELYGWMQGELAKMYYDYYKFAFDVARQAEFTMKHELMRPEVDQRDFLKFNYWDAGRKGLLSGERLYLDLKRLELAYHENNKREYELTKHISLRRVSPISLLQLKATGACEVTIPEWVFDLDCPGHYMRRIKSVGVSIPAVAGPYTSVNCTLSLQRSSIRKSALLADGEYARQEEDDRFIDYYGAIQSIVTSSAQNDSGMFEVNLRDDRFLPFEGAGTDSTWRIELPAELRQFDYNTINDVILHVRYTARQGGGLLGAGAADHIRTLVEEASTSGLSLLLSLKHDFPNEWHRFVAADGDDFSATVTRDHFPYLAQGFDLDNLQLQVYSLQDRVLTPLPAAAIVGHTLDEINDEGQGVFTVAEGQVDKEAELFLLVRYTLG